MYNYLKKKIWIKLFTEIIFFSFVDLVETEETIRGNGKGKVQDINFHLYYRFNFIKCDKKE